MLGQTGNDAGDVLAPYEVFASSARFSVYTVAATAHPVRLVGGPALVPALTFAMLDAGAAPKPDVVVIPAVGEPAGQPEAPVRAWVMSQAARGARILAVCAGSRLLAATGLLDGKKATSHWSRIQALRKTNPEVTWVDGERYVQDGRMTTTAGVSSAIPGSLRLVQDLAGPAEAPRVARSFTFPGWSLDGSTRIPRQRSPSRTWGSVSISGCLGFGRWSASASPLG